MVGLIVFGFEVEYFYVLQGGVWVLDDYEGCGCFIEVVA